MGLTKIYTHFGNLQQNSVKASDILARISAKFQAINSKRISAGIPEEITRHIPYAIARDISICREDNLDESRKEPLRNP